MKNVLKTACAILALALGLCACTPVDTSSGSDGSEGTVQNGTSGTVTDPDVYGGIFAKDVIEISINMGEDNLQSLNSSASEEVYYPAEVNVAGYEFGAAGIKARGNTVWVSGRDSNRYSFKLNFGKFEEGEELEGLDQLCLNNISYDPSYMREYLALEAFRMLGEDVPLATYAKVTVNGEYLGLYLAVEAVDDSYLNRAYGNNDGSLYKAEKDADLTEYAPALFDLQNGDDESMENIGELVHALQTGEGIEDILNVSSALRYLAVCSALANTDSYLGKDAENYYLYDNGGRLSVIPWSLSLSFGTDKEEIKSDYAIDPELKDAAISAPYFDTEAEKRPLCSALLSNGAYYEEYISYVNTLALWLEGLDLSALDGRIGEYVAADPTAVYGNEKYLSELLPEGEGLAAFIKARATALKAQLED